MSTPFVMPLLRVMRREFRRIAGRPTLWMLSIGLPVGMFLFLAYIYKDALVRELPVAVCDEDGSELSRMIIRSVDATASMKVVMRAHSMNEIREAMLAGNVQAGIYIPRRFEADVKGGTSSTVTVVKNTFNLIIGNLIYRDAATILKTVSGGALLKKLRSRGMSGEQAMNVINPIRLDTQVLYNSNYSYLNYLIPPMLAVVLQMVIMVSGVLVFSSEFTHGTMDELLETGNNSLAAVLLGKALPHFLVHASTALGIIGLVMPIFGLGIGGSSALVFGLLLLFVAASLALALAISGVVHEQLKATEVAVFLVTPAFVFSGLTFPAWAMPALHSWYAQTMPFTPFLSAFLKLYQMNTPVTYIAPEALHLSAFLILSTAVAIVSLRRQIHRHITSRMGTEASS
ncbi:MAG: ABC transporter permease [Acidobacteriota bacterium]